MMSPHDVAALLKVAQEACCAHMSVVDIRVRLTELYKKEAVNLSRVQISLDQAAIELSNAVSHITQATFRVLEKL